VLTFVHLEKKFVTRINDVFQSYFDLYVSYV